LVDAEGCFIIAILPSTGPNKKKISLRLSVTQKSHSVGVLYDLQNFFGCGQVIISSKDCMRFVVQRKEDILNKIIPHFTDFPLVTSKELNFETLKEAALIVARGEHLNPIGLDKIISLKALMNKKRSFEELFGGGVAFYGTHITNNCKIKNLCKFNLTQEKSNHNHLYKELFTIYIQVGL
jgi:hypothetical protein